MNQRWVTPAVATNTSVMPNGGMFLQHKYFWKSSRNLTHAFVQMTGDDVTHLILQEDGGFCGEGKDIWCG